ncbi:Ribosomal silencing factor RsfS [Enhygromyxa salina]|uniref:Ribosomal silencing factor RsfS n=1 Tax=Enhygromyxa salina TaxID=215803 RepID=A0A2S9XC17_9BACT|nr:Ribosomal silencing factor RsfS [Enhygromyxa salina]
MILRLTEVAGYTDWALLVSARSERQVQGIVDAILEAARGEGAKLIGSDGLDLYLWALLDYDDFLIHVFYHPVRRHYDLESMWSDAPRVELGLPAEVMDDSELDGLTAPDPMPSYRGDLAFGGFEDEFVDDDGDDDEAEDDPEFVDDDLFDDDPPATANADTEAGSSVNPDDDLFDT